MIKNNPTSIYILQKWRRYEIKWNEEVICIIMALSRKVVRCSRCSMVFLLCTVLVLVVATAFQPVDFKHGNLELVFEFPLVQVGDSGSAPLLAIAECRFWEGGTLAGQRQLLAGRLPRRM